MFLCVVMMNNNDESFGWRHDLSVIIALFMIKIFNGRILQIKYADLKSFFDLKRNQLNQLSNML